MTKLNEVEVFYGLQTLRQVLKDYNMTIEADNGGEMFIFMNGENVEMLNEITSQRLKDSLNGRYGRGVKLRGEQ